MPCVDDVSIGGQWDWVESSGSFAGVTITPETENKTMKIIITEDFFQSYVDGVLSFQTGYEFIKSDELKSYTDEGLVLKLDNGDRYAVFRYEDRLILREPCVDCWEHLYKLSY